MGLSFGESLKRASVLNTDVAATPATLDMESMAFGATEGVPMTADIQTLDASEAVIEAYAGDMEEWKPLDRYQYTNDYSDESVSYVDEYKNVVLDPKQVNLTQERNSQYVTFEMPRKYDGFDLTNVDISIFFVNKNGYAAVSKAINVYYTDTKIRFGWLIDENATAVDGKLSFEIQAVGYNSAGQSYIWKTRPNTEMTVLPSLTGRGEIVPDNTWITDFLVQVTEKVGEAQAASNQAFEYSNAALQAVEQAQATVDNAKAELADSIDSKIDTELDSYYTKEEVDAKLDDLDISDKIPTDFYSKSDADAKFATQASLNAVDEVVSDLTKTVSANTTAISDVQADLQSYKATAAETFATKVDLDSYYAKSEVDNLIKNIDVSDQLQEIENQIPTDFYTTSEADAKFATQANLSATNSSVSAISSNVSTNATNISTLSGKVSELEETVSGIDNSPRLKYEATYDAEQIYTLWEIEGEGDSEVRTAKGQFKIQGGGGSSTSSVLKIEYITKTPFVVTVDDEAWIHYNFSGTDSNNDEVQEGLATWKVGGRIVATEIAVAGENKFNVTEYLTLGTQKVMLSITDDAGSLVTKSWTVQKIDVRLESAFNDKYTYPLETVSFDYTPFGAISKDIHFVLDGEELPKVTTTSSGVPMAYVLPEQQHGAHLLDVYITATVNNNDITSNHITKDIIWYDENSNVPIIGSVFQDFTARQYDSTNIEYTVYDPSTETPKIEIAVNGEVVSTPTMTSNTDVYVFKAIEPGEYVITITCGETVKTLKATIEELDIEIEPVTAGLVFDFNPAGKSNNDADRVWVSENASMSVSDDFDWVNGGYQIDDDGDQYFCIKAGTSATIDYQLFADDAKKNGKEFKMVFKTTNVQSPDAIFLECLDNTTDTDYIGIQMGVHEASIFGQAGSLALPYSEDDIIEFEFNISKDTESIPMVMGYEDGVSTRNMVYDDSHGFTQNTQKMIQLGSEKCDLHIYRMKAYNASLTDRGILSNFIADARSAEEMIDRYNRNQIYDENSQLDPDVLAEKCPWLRVYKLSAPYFTNNKSDKVPGTIIQQIYKGGDPVLDNWTCYDCMHSGQGTSSNNYGAAGRNLDFIMNKSGIEGVEPYFIMGDSTRATKITMSRTSVPVAYLNAKVNIASSNNLTNAMLANRYNTYNPYKRKFVRGEGVNTSFIKDTMEFHNCVIFIQETNEDLSTHREFADNGWHFYAVGNIGDSKKTDDTRLTDPADKYECCVEIMDVQLPLSDFPADTMYNAMDNYVDEETGETIYVWAKDENLGILHEKIDGEYVLTSDTTVDLNKIYYVDILEHDDFSEDFTYGWRYIYEGDDDAENAEVFDYCKQKWIEAYRFITTSTDEEFKAGIGNYFVMDSVLFNYLFTTRYCMVDNRAKNTFWHYGKTGEVDAEGNPIRKWDLNWDYDNDTALGLNNYGKQVYRYGLEDTDRDAKGEEIFREMDSTFFCRIRDLFQSELKAMYNTLESKNAWHAESFLNQCDAWQDEFPEELWRIDIERKYKRTYNSSFINGEGDSQFLVNMSNGRMKYQRRQWERSQEKYMASKFQSSLASADSATLRCTVPTGDLAVEPNYSLKITPYAYMYLSTQYGTQAPGVPKRVEPNIEYELSFSGAGADIIKIYSASMLKSVGDLSACYPATVGTSTAGKLTELIIGNETEGYDNPSLTDLTLGANYLLKKFNIENVSGYTSSLNLSELSNLEECYAHGSGITGATFADGGNIRIIELPAISSLTIKNLKYLTTLDIESYDNLVAMTVENCTGIDLLSVLRDATKLNRVRIIGVNWTLEDVSLLERLYNMRGFDKENHNTDRAVLSGYVYVPVIRQQKLYDYQQAWPDLEISYGSMIEQVAVTFKNYDGTVLEIQYVDKGGAAIDPSTRDTDPIIPIRESDVEFDYTFSGWDGVLTNVFSVRTLTAQYTETTRSYTIRYVSKGSVLQESVGLYGENVAYAGETPVYTAEEVTHTYHLFNRWDQSGVINGDKTVNAVFDKFVYYEDETAGTNAFGDKKLADLSPVEIYAFTQLYQSQAISEEVVSKIVTDGAPYSFTFGNDVEYDDIESELLIAEKTEFNGTNYIDTGIKLFDIDRDFVLAVDFKFDSSNATKATLMQCFQTNGSHGFKLACNGTIPTLSWGSNSSAVATIEQREMLVIRHRKGDNNLTIYNSNLNGDSVSVVTLERNKATAGVNTLVFGCAKGDDGIYQDYAKGIINWCKLWYTDLGEETCKSLAEWPHEQIAFQACGFRRYYLSNMPENEFARCTFTLVASHLLERVKAWNPANSNTGGWKDSALNKFLNQRLYNAIPEQLRSLIKQVKVPSTIGNKSVEIDTADCYIAIPSRAEVDIDATNEPYSSEGSLMGVMTKANDRRRALPSGEYNSYWLRSPLAEHDLYVYTVQSDGYVNGYNVASNLFGVLIVISL